MYSFRKSKKGFTLIELMVVVAIIAVLALLGLRLYSTQQIKAKEALVKANAGTIQVAIQTELIDTPSLGLGAALDIADLDVIQNPFTGATDRGTNNTEGAFGDGTGWTFDTANLEGMVGVTESNHVFTMTSYGEDGKDLDYVVYAQP